MAIDCLEIEAKEADRALKADEILAKIDRMPREELGSFQRFGFKDRDHYMGIQNIWIKVHRHYKGKELQRYVSPDEAILSFAREGQCYRFRAFYAMMYPDKVRDLGKVIRSEPAADAQPQPQLALAVA